MARPESTEHAPYYAKYIALVPEDDIVERDEVGRGEARSRSWPAFPRARRASCTRRTRGRSSKSSAI